MKQITLELFLLLMNLQSPSGIVYQHDHIHVISDNSTFFYRYDTQDKLWSQTPISELDYGLVEIPKDIKPDFQAITYDQMDFYIFGSGKNQSALDMVRVNKMNYQVQEIEYLDILYDSMMDIGNISVEDFNIQGVIKNQNKWYFFNRGTSPENKNGIFVVDAQNIIDHFNVYYLPIKLPKINKKDSGFTDATLVGNSIYFIATPIDQEDTFLDQKNKGTLIGEITLDKLKVKKTKVISKELNFQGITLYDQNKNNLSFLLSLNPGNTHKQTAIYKLNFKK
ncbi:DUF6929 family protein [Myroides sp. LJL119]